VILGDNGTGKTTLLECLSILEIKTQYDKNGIREKRHYLNYNKIIDSKSYYDSSKNFNILSFNEQSDISKIDACLFYPEKDRINPNCGNRVNTYDLSLSYSKGAINFGGNFYQKLNNDFSIYAYGANRRIGSSKLKDSLNIVNNETLFNEDARLINVEEWLLQLDYAASKDSEIKQFAIRKRDQVKQIICDLLPDIEEIRFSTPTINNLLPKVEFKTNFGWVTVDKLSLGYKTMVAWMVDLAARMFERYPESHNPLSEPAIVLVDEIDLHLHPRWQRKIFTFLNEKFPKTQFIITAHSPLVVQSAPKGVNIVLLRKKGDGVFIDNDTDSVQGWRIDQILTSDLFGFDNTRDLETEKLLEERTELLKKEDLSDIEQKRLIYLNKFAFELPSSENKVDNEAMDIIRQAAEYLKKKHLGLSNDKNNG